MLNDDKQHQYIESIVTRSDGIKFKKVKRVCLHGPTKGCDFCYCYNYEENNGHIACHPFYYCLECNEGSMCYSCYGDKKPCGTCEKKKNQNLEADRLAALFD